MIGALLFGAVGDAAATAWVLPKGRLVLGLGGGVSFASSEYLPDGEHRDFPLRGRFESYTLQIDGRYGLGWNFELQVSTSLKGISFQSDPVLLYSGSPPTTLEAYRASVYDFSERALGLSDVYIAVGHQHLKSPLRISSFLEIKLPSGYRQPQGTFSKDNPGPGNLADDVTLGDGQLDLTYRLHLGYLVHRTLTLFEASAGYRARFNGPGHQVLGQLKIGQLIGKYLVLLGGAEAAFTIFPGEVVGRTFVAKDPSVPAEKFEFDTNVEQRLLRLDRSFVNVFGGAIARVAGREWVLRVSRIVWGKNYSQLTSFYLGVLLTFG